MIPAHSQGSTDLVPQSSLFPIHTRGSNCETGGDGGKGATSCESESDKPGRKHRSCWHAWGIVRHWLFTAERVRSCVPGFCILAEFGRYWNDEEQTKKVMRPDPEDESVVWMHTGDEGIIDEEGYLRSKSL